MYTQQRTHSIHSIVQRASDRRTPYIYKYKHAFCVVISLDESEPDRGYVADITNA